MYGPVQQTRNNACMVKEGLKECGSSITVNSGFRLFHIIMLVRSLSFKIALIPQKGIVLRDKGSVGPLSHKNGVKAQSPYL